MPDQISISMKAIRWVASGSEGSVLTLFVLDLAINYICSDFPGQWLNLLNLLPQGFGSERQH